MIWLSLRELDRSGISHELFPSYTHPYEVDAIIYLLLLLCNSRLLPHSVDCFSGGNLTLTYGSRRLLRGVSFPHCITFPNLHSSVPHRASWNLPNQVLQA